MDIIVRRAEKAESCIIMNFQLMMALETEKIKLDPFVTLKGVEAVFDDPSKGFYLLATIGDDVVGSLMITYEWSDWRNRTIYWIQSVFVKPEFRKLGVYSQMYEFLKESIQYETAVGGIRLYVDRSNTGAQAVYARMGMNGEHYQVFEWMKDF